MLNHLIPAEFLGKTLSIIERDGQKWLTAEQVGRALGYSAGNENTGATNLYNRHRDEFAETDTCTIKLMANPLGGSPITRIFSATGCVLLSFFSGTPRAVKFRAWAKEALAAPAADHLQNFALTAEDVPAVLRKLARERDAATQASAALARALLAARPQWARLLRYRGMGLSQRETALLMKWHLRTVSRSLRAMQDAGLSIPPSRVPPPCGTLVLSAPLPERSAP